MEDRNETKAPTPLSARFDAAMAMASVLHRDQFRKGATIPYISHLMAVSALVLENGGDEDQAIAALLHDAVEDQGGQETLDRIRSGFGVRVADIVEACTDAWVEPKPDWHARKKAYLAKLPDKGSDAQLVSLADKVHNARAIRDDYRELGDELWERFRVERHDIVWYYTELAKIFTKALPGRLSKQLAEIVDEFPGPETD